jgi:hypothetical protein
MVAALGRSGTSSCAGHCPADRRRARSSNSSALASGPLPTARAARSAASPTPPRLPEMSSLPVVHSRPRTGGMPRSRRMTEGGVREAPSRTRWTRAATWADLRRVRGPRLPPYHPAPQDARRAQGRPQAADLSTAHGRSPGPTISARRRSGAARPASASPPPGGSRPIGCTRWSRASRTAGPPCTGAEALRARVRATQERVGAATAPRPWARSGAAARRPDDPRQARVCAQPGASRVARGLAAHSLR